jgi:hypothetical protein
VRNNLGGKDEKVHRGRNSSSQVSQRIKERRLG